MLSDQKGENGLPLKYVCPSCGKDAVSASAMGDRYLHCFSRCMADFEKSDCPTRLVASETELAALGQVAD